MKKAFQAYEGTEEVDLVSNLHIISDYVFAKYERNAFSNPKLNEFLKNILLNVGKLLVLMVENV